MARVPYVERDQLDAEGQAVYDKICRDRNIARPGLQFRALMHDPKATGYLNALGAQLRYHSAIPENLKEVAVLAVSREWNSAMEWTAHAPLAARAGVSSETIEVIRTRGTLSGLTEQEQLITRFVQQLLRDKELSDVTFNAAAQLLGTVGVVDLVLICSYYSALSIAQIALKPELEAGKVSTL
jgi:4-carboxymuconolactone decarboxylase